MVVDSEEYNFEGKIRIRKSNGGYLVIPKEIMEKSKAEVGNVVKVIFHNAGTSDGEYFISTTIQKPPTIYLRDLDLRMIGVVDKDDEIHPTNITVTLKVIG